jgi:threonine aldolase
MFCLSKGLCAPVGSLLAGSRELIALARRRRKVMGGGMRQAGVIAAAGIVALRDMTGRLAEDHAKARDMASAFAETGLMELRPSPPRVNMLFVRFRGSGSQAAGERLLLELRAQGVLTYEPEGGWIRFVTHHDVSAAEIKRVCRLLPEAVARAAAGRQ